MTAIDLFWFRRDLRLEDNHGLYLALTAGRQVMPIFIFDRLILDRLEDRDDRRVSFIHQWLETLHHRLGQRGSTLQVFHGEPLTVMAQLVATHTIAAVHCNEDYEPYARQRDRQVAELLAARDIAFHSYKDTAILAKGEVLKADGQPYTVFTPYSRKWRELLTAADTLSHDLEPHFGALLRAQEPAALPRLEALGFQPDGRRYPLPDRDSLDIDHYDTTRDRPDWETTTQLGAHLRFGTVSIRRLARWGARHNQVWLTQLIWRDFFMQILYHYPHVVAGPFRPQYSLIAWRDDEAGFQRWCEGTTGYPMVDAGMRQLRETGYMHNRVRMIAASFLCKHLLIDWRRGEAHFARYLLDFDLAANNGNWQWAAGTGCDAAPYFRVFSPARQAEKFDPDRIYQKRWLPGLDTRAYPRPIVDHDQARKRALAVYKQGVADWERLGATQAKFS